MATAALYPAIQQPTAAQPAAPAKLNPYVQMLPDSSPETWATVWYVASIVTLVAFVAFATLAILLTGIYEPVFLPVVTILCLRLIDDAWSIHAYFQGMMEEENFLADIEARTEKNLKKLPLTAPELAAHLAPLQAHLQLPKIDNLVEFRPVLARYFSWKEKMVDFTEQVEAHLAEGEKSPEKLQEMRLQAIRKHEWALASRMFAAYMRAVLLNPHLPYKWDELFEFPVWKKPLQQRLCEEGLLARYKQKGYEETFVTFKKPGRTSCLTTRDMRTISEIEIATLLNDISTG